MAVNAEFVIWGAAGHALVLADWISRRGGRLVALFDNAADARSPIADVPLFIGAAGFAQWSAEATAADARYGLVAIGGGRGKDRLERIDFFHAHGITTPPLVHPDATVQAGATLGDGSQVLAQAVVAAGARIGRGCIINHRAGVDHECTLGDGVHIAPGATLCGCVTVADHAFVGAGATVLPRIRIGAAATIGAGAVVTRDVPDGVTVVGNPARIHHDT